MHPRELASGTDFGSSRIGFHLRWERRRYGRLPASRDRSRACDTLALGSRYARERMGLRQGFASHGVLHASERPHDCLTWVREAGARFGDGRFRL